MKNLCIVFCFLLCSVSAFSQELKATVTVNSTQLSFADPNTLKAFENTVTEYFNNTVWSDEEFEDHQRIEVDFTIFIKDDPAPSQFIADISFQALRPVYNSNYKSPVLSYVDKDIAFSYLDLQPIQNNTNSYTDNLSSMLSFYAQIILGADYDTFSPNGGEVFYQNAQDIMNRVPTTVAAGTGWTREGGENTRFFYIENIFNPKIRNLRQSIYEYHRMGLDIMHKDQDKALAIMTSAITTLETVNKTYPNSMITQVFSDTKIDEIVQVFKGGTNGQKDKVYKIMVNIDPARSSTYNEINRL